MFEIGLEVMKKVGFTGYESLVLQTLFVVGNATAKKIHEKSGVPLPRVYQILDAFRKNGYVKENASITPKQYEPVDTAIISNKLQHTEKYAPIKIKEFREYLENIKSWQILKPEYYSLVETGDESEKETLKLYRSAQKEILVISRGMGYLTTVYDGLFEAAKKGVKIKILFPSRNLLREEEISGILDRINLLRELYVEPSERSLEIRYRPRFYELDNGRKMPIENWIHCSIVDPPTLEQAKGLDAYRGTHTGAAIYTTDLREAMLSSAILKYGKLYAVLTKEPKFIMSLKLFFMLLWKNSSTEFSEKKEISLTL